MNILKNGNLIWKNEDLEEFEALLILHNKHHVRQARHTPFTVQPLKFKIVNSDS